MKISIALVSTLPLLLLLVISATAQTWEAVLQTNRKALEDTDRYVISRTGHGMVAGGFNESALYIFGGRMQFSIDGSPFDKNYWRFDLRDFHWDAIPLDGQLTPNARYHHVFVPHSSGQYALLHGGDDDILIYKDIWVLDFGSKSSGSSGLPTWNFVNQEFDPSPPNITVTPCVVNDTDVQFSLVAYTKPVNYTWDELENQFYFYANSSISFDNLYPAFMNGDDEVYAIRDKLIRNDSYVSGNLRLFDTVYNYTFKILNADLVEKTSVLDCYSLDWSELPYPALERHAAAHDPYSDLFYLHGGAGLNASVIESALYSLNVYTKTLGSNLTWYGNMTRVATKPGTDVGYRSHSLTVVPFKNQPSLLVMFGGVLFDANAPFDQQYKRNHRLSVMDLSAPVPQWTVQVDPLGSRSSTLGHTAIYNQYHKQIWFVGGDVDPGLHYMLDIQSRNYTSWTWRANSESVKYLTHYHQMAVAKDNRGKMTLFKFGGEYTGSDVQIPYMESTLFESALVNRNGTLRYEIPGELTIKPPPPAPLSPVSQSRTSNVTVSVSTRKSVGLEPVAVKSEVGGIAGIVQEINSDGSYQLIVYGTISIVAVIILVAVIIGCLQGRRLKKKKRPNKSNFYSL